MFQMPELNAEAATDSEEGACLPTFIIQNIGLLCGVFIMYTLARFSENIDVERKAERLAAMASSNS